MKSLILCLILLSTQAAADISQFPKWARVVAATEAPISLEQAGHADDMIAVNKYVNSIKYVEDQKNYGAGDYWATPAEFEAKGSGDCEDYAIDKYYRLLTHGFTDDQMQIVVGYNASGVVHSILRVELDGKYYYLDNNLPDVSEKSTVKRAYSINRYRWWR